MKKNVIASLITLATLCLAGCNATLPSLGGFKDNAATGAAESATPEEQNTALEHCDVTLGTLSVFEDRTLPWWDAYYERYPKLGTTIPLIRTLIQQSNCFVVVERGLAMEALRSELALIKSGDMRSDSDFGNDQMAAADYTLNPSIQFPEKDTGGISGLIGGMIGSVGTADADELKPDEASTTLLLVDNRSGVQISEAIGNAKNWDINVLGGVLGSGAGGANAFTGTQEGKILTAAFADAYNKMVTALRNHKAQIDDGGLDKGDKLKVDE